MDDCIQVWPRLSLSILSCLPRKFIVIGNELRKSNSIRIASRQQGTLKLVRTGAATGAVLEEMGAVSFKAQSAYHISCVRQDDIRT